MQRPLAAVGHHGRPLTEKTQQTPSRRAGDIPARRDANHRHQSEKINDPSIGVVIADVMRLRPNPEGKTKVNALATLLARGAAVVRAIIIRIEIILR